LTSYKIVTLGGGTGHFALISGLKRLNDPTLITAVTGATDSGGSSGGLRSELGVLPPGDARQCILAFAPDGLQKDLVNLFQFRFPADTAWAGHNPINIELAALEIIYGSQELAIRAFQNMHGIPGTIVPISLNKTNLVAKLSDGRELIGESSIDLRRQEADFDAGVAIDYIALDAPAFLYTSLLPHLLVDHVAETIVRSPARKMYCGNLMTKAGETDGFKASDFLRELVDYLGEPCLDVAIFNGDSLPEDVIAAYAREGQSPVEVDAGACRALLPNLELKVLPLAYFPKNQRILRHNTQLLAQAILDCLD
jgi:2-phospho-L-lactate transferase/gluconeogenesis factor (CofD/UPF0052 family)